MRILHQFIGLTTGLKLTAPIRIVLAVVLADRIDNRLRNLAAGRSIQVDDRLSSMLTGESREVVAELGEHGGGGVEREWSGGGSGVEWSGEGVGVGVGVGVRVVVE